jgi:ATP-dependent Clp protease protease subunit
MSKSLLEFKSKAKQPFSIKAKSETSAEIIIYGTIGGDWFGDGLTAKAFSDELKKLGSSVKELHVRINSPGGSVFEGITIHNRLKQHKSKKFVYIDGLAASIASIIALAGDEIIIGDGAMYMIHLPWSVAMGDRKEMESMADLLVGIEEQMIGIYSKATGLDRHEIKKMMEDETWMDADAAIEKGFVHKKAEDSLPIAASAMKSQWFRRAPTNYKSETKAITAGIEELKKKIGALARK